MRVDRRYGCLLPPLQATVMIRHRSPLILAHLFLLSFDHIHLALSIMVSSDLVSYNTCEQLYHPLIIRYRSSGPWSDRYISENGSGG